MRIRLLSLMLLALLAMTQLAGCYGLGRAMGDLDRSIRESAADMNQGYDDGRSSTQGLSNELDPPDKGGEGHNDSAPEPEESL